MSTNTKPQLTERDASRRWWFKYVVVPMVGTLLGGGGITALVTSLRGPRELTDSRPPVSTDGGPNISSSYFGSNTVVGGAKSVFHLPAHKEPQEFSRDVTLHQQESKSVQGVSIQAGLIGASPGGGVYVELAVSDRGETKFDRKAISGEQIPVRSAPDESLIIEVNRVEQYPKDPTKTMEELQKLGPAAEAFVERKATLKVSGKTRNPEPVPVVGNDIDQNDYTIVIPFIGPTDVRTLDHNFWSTYFIRAAMEGIQHDLEVFLRLKFDVDYKDSLGNTALMHTLLANRLDCFKLLLAHGADPSIKNNNGYSVLGYVNRPDMVDYAEAVRKAQKTK